ncbi:TetR/AcrR family transcriptional regulator [Ruegeria sp. HKCCA5491]|uniref:TetR/AcrR family transcriptional regulator n=1 Tax=Ruegeria sp. HKCCA5491 TaxID=2682986 RepID=UPI00148939B5|nr:TetR/AcrR family transcriptional regulator [Ruegeria sp. HKCCA5491]
MNTRSNIVTAGQSLIGQKGFSAVGLAEILKAAGVPKGSFYHFFESKDAFGVVLLNEYFESYHANLDHLFAKQGLTAAEMLMLYFSNWRENQGLEDCESRCLAVKLGAEVSDFSEPMRSALKTGTDGIISRLATVVQAGVSDGSLRVSQTPTAVAASLYYLWLGASIMVKISKSHDPFEIVLTNTRQTLGIGASN